MFATWLKRLVIVAVLAALGYGAYAMIQPQPVPVDLAVIGRGAIETTIGEEGETRVKDVYRISAPISGKLERLTLKVGDEVTKGRQIARIRPVDPPMRNIRTRRELASATKAAAAAVELAKAEISKATSALQFSKSDLARARRLVKSKTITTVRLEQAQLDVLVKTALLAEARSNLELRQHRLESAKASQRERFERPSMEAEDQCCMPVVTPVSGTVLKLVSESEQVVPAGKQLVEVGNLSELEIVVDLLSADAVAISPGTPARIEGWGGEGVLNAKVRRIDPAGFTKVSALGIEEQRVNVLLDISDPKARWKRLGHSYRVVIHLITAYKKSVPRVPLSALFRKGDQWAVYVARDGKAVRMPVKLGLFSQTHVELLGGIDEGASVILYPSDKVDNGTLVVARSDAK